MLLSNSTAEGRFRSDLERGMEAGCTTAHLAQANAEGRIRYKNAVSLRKEQK